MYPRIYAWNDKVPAGGCKIGIGFTSNDTDDNTDPSFAFKGFALCVSRIGRFMLPTYSLVSNTDFRDIIAVLLPAVNGHTFF